MRPLVVTNAAPDMRLLRTDVFAPVVSLVGVDDAEEALLLDAQCPYALGATVFGPAAEARRFAQRVEAGVVVVNDMIVPTADPRLPFGGRGGSGFGSTRGAEGLLELTAPRVVIERQARTHPHFETLQPDDERLFESYLKASHSRRWSDRFHGWRSLIRDLRHQEPRCKGGEMSPTTSGDSRVGVVGGGLGGLAAACTLAARGHRVTLFEKNSWLGGKAAVLEEEGYRFDMGPTILTVPRVLRRIFAEAGQEPRGRAGSGSARPAVALLLRGRLGARSIAGHGADGAEDRRILVEFRAMEPATATSSSSPRNCTTSRTASSSGNRSRTFGTPWI